ncbi:MAG: RsmB/NOP family class I SAM-dependent RNA methyltransferase [Nanoarchaeota archaeon]
MKKKDFSRAPNFHKVFEERIKKLLVSKDDFDKYVDFSSREPLCSIRCNTLKISPKELLFKLRSNGWVVDQPFSSHPEIMVVTSILQPGALGKSVEHLLGYFYVQEISSMLPIIALNPKSDDRLLDLCSAPGSKTTQAAASMFNNGLLIANDNSPSRTRVLAANLERMGVSNTLVTCEDGSRFCDKTINKTKILFSKVLLDAPCSGEGTVRSSRSAASDWSLDLVQSLSKRQKKLIVDAFRVLEVGGVMIYSTCTHSPEENEEVVDFLIKNYDAEVLPISIPVKSRSGLTSWDGKKFDSSLVNACRIYPQDNDTEGFFLCKIKKLSNSKRGTN